MKSGVWAPLLLLGLGLLIGGGGSPAPIAEAAVEVAAALLFLTWWWGSDLPLARRVPALALVIAGLVMLVPVLQLIPLPPAVWHALPGREAEREALALVGRADDWRTLSFAPRQTLASLLALIPTAAMIAMISSLNLAERLLVARVLAIGGIATLLVGAGQVSGGPDTALRFYGAGSPYLEGFQANHNSTADVLLVALLAAIAWIRDSAQGRQEPVGRRGPVLALALASLVMFGLGVVLTASRAGMALLPIVLVIALYQLRPWLRGSRRAVTALVLGGILLATVVGVGLARNAALSRIADRFDTSTELRPDLWADAIHAGKAYFPVGVGIGNFVPALIANERLEVVRPSLPNRAHNDYLELFVEAGFVGLATLLVIAFLLARSVYELGRSGGDTSMTMALFGGGCLLILALHSLVDYPLRSMSIALAAGACAAIVMPLPRVAAARQGRTDRLEQIR